MIVLYWVKTWTCLQDHDLKDIHEMLPLNPTTLAEGLKSHWPSKHISGEG